MNCAQLESALRDLSESLGYSFSLLPANRIAEINKFPRAVLEPPTIAKVEGRGHGRISYNIHLHLMKRAARLSAEERFDLLNEMESDMLDILTDLSESEQVIVVEDIGITPQEYALTTHGELSQNAQAKVVLYF